MDSDSLVQRIADRVGATRQETAGLLVLVVVGVAVVLLLWAWQRPATMSDADAGTVSSSGTLTSAEVVVHVTGAVATPGVVTTVDGARIVDVIALAGGATATADLGGLNLARPVVDGEQIVVPERRASSAAGAAEPVDAVHDADGRLRINVATARELEELPGVGPVLAERIVAYREANGPFASAGDLRRVPGIGEKTFQNLAPLIVV